MRRASRWSAAGPGSERVVATGATQDGSSTQCSSRRAALAFVEVPSPDPRPDLAIPGDALREGCAVRVRSGCAGTAGGSRYPALETSCAGGTPGSGADEHQRADLRFGVALGGLHLRHSEASRVSTVRLRTVSPVAWSFRR